MTIQRKKDHVSYSELMTYVRCRRLWGYRYLYRVFPEVKSKNLLLGTAIHKALAHYYSPEQDQSTIPETTITLYYEVVERMLQHIEEITGLEPPEPIATSFSTGGDMLVQYLAWAPNVDTWETKGVEVPFSVPIVDGLDFVGYIDLLAWEPETQESWVVDHKTYAHISAAVTDDQFYDLQGTVYMWAMRQHPEMAKKNFVGITYNILSKHPPKFPKTLKNGQLSKAKTQRTTPDLYMQRVVELGLDPADYEDLVATLDPDKFNRRVLIRVSEKRIDWFSKQLVTLTHMVANTYEAGEIALVPSTSRQCGYCDYAPLCKAAFEGYDWRSCAQGFTMAGEPLDDTVVEDEDA